MAASSPPRERISPQQRYSRCARCTGSVGRVPNRGLRKSRCGSFWLLEVDSRILASTSGTLPSDFRRLRIRRHLLRRALLALCPPSPRHFRCQEWDPLGSSCRSDFQYVVHAWSVFCLPHAVLRSNPLEFSRHVGIGRRRSSHGLGPGLNSFGAANDMHLCHGSCRCRSRDRSPEPFAMKLRVQRRTVDVNRRFDSKSLPWAF